jgi:hypothetical protein
MNQKLRNMFYNDMLDKSRLVPSENPDRHDMFEETLYKLLFPRLEVVEFDQDAFEKYSEIQNVNGLCRFETYLPYIQSCPPYTKYLLICHYSRQNEGYCLFRPIGGSMMLVHRYIYINCNGYIPSGMCVCHKNDIKIDCNPHNLKCQTLNQNNLQSGKNGRRYGQVLEQTIEFYTMVLRLMDENQGYGQKTKVAKKLGVKHASTLSNYLERMAIILESEELPVRNINEERLWTKFK